ncbi:MAG: TMEM14 family protein, partial [Cyanobacteria bacterium J06638_6]
MPTGALYAIAYAALSAIGGLIGYVQARSQVSLIS